MKKSRLDQWICHVEGIPELTREILEEIQLRRLNQVLTALRARGGFYRNLPDKLNTLQELKALPFTTAEDIAAAPMQFLLVSQAEVSRIISGATSGTTGPAKRIFYTPRDTEHTVGFFAAGIGEMLSPGEKCMIAFPFTGPFGLGDLIAKAVERLGGIPVKAGFGGTYDELCKLVAEERPETYIGFPVCFLSLQRMYGEDFPIKRALLSADACPDGVMEALKDKGISLYPHYGSREMCLGGAVTCPAQEGMHLRENHILAEIIDESGNPLPDGQWGELVITTIDMEAMPLIRYRTGDRARFLPERCPCGSVTRRLDRVSRLDREEGAMERLDSLLFSCPDLVDYRAAWTEGKLKLEALLLREEGRKQLEQLLAGVNAEVFAEPALKSCRPMYPGKRTLIVE